MESLYHCGCGETCIITISYVNTEDQTIKTQIWMFKVNSVSED